MRFSRCFHVSNNYPAVVLVVVVVVVVVAAAAVAWRVFSFRIRPHNSQRLFARDCAGLKLVFGRIEFGCRHSPPLSGRGVLFSGIASCPTPPLLQTNVPRGYPMTLDSLELVICYPTRDRRINLSLSFDLIPSQAIYSLCFSLFRNLL